MGILSVEASSDEMFQRVREGYFGTYFPSCE